MGWFSDHVNTCQYKTSRRSPKMASELVRSRYLPQWLDAILVPLKSLNDLAYTSRRTFMETIKMLLCPTPITTALHMYFDQLLCMSIFQISHLPRNSPINALGHCHPISPPDLSRHPPELEESKRHGVRIPPSIVFVICHAVAIMSVK